MRVVVTRPAAQAAEWVSRLRSHGIDAAALPLMGIAPASDTAPIRATWARLPDLRLVVFVSPNAAEQFFAHRPPHTEWPASAWAGSPGPGTTHALRGLGVPGARIIEPAGDAAQFDSESLWSQLAGHDWHAAQVVIVRGEGGGRDWLATQLTSNGAQVRHLAAYRRAPPVLSEADRELLAAARGAPAAHVWLFSSSEAIDHLAQAVPGAQWSRARAVATHPRIAERARQLGFSSVAQARPALDAVVACIQSLAP
jgi:uroporphyrinogen-III synthase